MAHGVYNEHMCLTCNILKLVLYKTTLICRQKSERTVPVRMCVCVIYNRERKIVLPIDCSRFPCHLRGVP